MQIKMMLLCFLFGVMGCRQGENDIDPGNNDNKETTKEFELKERADILLSGKQLESVKLQNDLAFRLVAKDNRDNESNTLLSPISVSLCLSMAANGVSDEVRDEIVNALLPTGGNIDALNELNKLLASKVTEVDNSAHLIFSNSVWVDKPYNVIPALSLNLKDFYSAEVANIAMHSEEGRDAINSWVASATGNLIPYLYLGIPVEDLLLINTVYFKGQWTVPFDKNKSEKAVFHNANGASQEITYMKSNKENFMYDINSSYSSVRLPYGNEAYSMYAVMPTGDNDISEILENLTPEKWENMKRNMSARRGVFVNLPVFEVKYDASKLKDHLMECGIVKLFTSKSALINFVSPTPAEGLLTILHKSILKVDETGAEGAALTSLGMVFDSEPDMTEATTPPTVTFDHPFFYIIEEQSTGAILFIGTINEL